MQAKLMVAAAFSIVAGGALTAFAEQQSLLSIRDERFLLDGRPIDLWGIRVGSATMDEAMCQHLIDQLDDYRLHGVNAVTVFYMGCSGGYDHANNEVIGRNEHVDVLLFDTAGSRPGSSELYRRFREAGVRDKPIVNVETFGGWTGKFPPGVFPEELRTAYRAEVDAAVAEPGLSVFLHNNPWLQGSPIRYNLAGEGTQEDPGIRWYFEFVKQRRGL